MGREESGPVPRRAMCLASRAQLVLLHRFL